MKVVDMHCDTIGEIYDRQKKGEAMSIRSNGFSLFFKWTNIAKF